MLFSMMLSGCSWVYNFNILNLSKETITVSYKLTGEHGIFLSSPGIRRGEIIDTTKNINISDNVVQFDLQPGETTTIANGINTSLKNIQDKKGYYAEELNLAWLKIKTTKDTKEYTLDNIESGLTTNKLALSEIIVK